ATSNIVAESAGKRVDCYGDPLPEGAVARIGTVRFRGPGRNPIHIQDLKFHNQIALSPDGKTLVLACPDGLHFWDIVTGKKLRRTVIFWDMATGKELLETVIGDEPLQFRKLPGKKIVVECKEITFSSDSKLLAVVTGGGRV